LLIEEEELVQWILAMEQRGFPSYLIDVKRMAQNLISRRGTPRSTRSIGKNWVYRFTERHPTLKKYRTRNKDYQRARQERPSVIQPWFQRIKDTKEQYGIVDADCHNFDETGFAMGVITGSATKVVGSSDNVARVAISQPGSSHGQNQGSSPIWTSETPKTVHQVAKQEQLIKEALLRSSQSPTEPISKLAKSAHQNLIQATLNQRYILELESTIQHQNKKKRQSKARLQIESGMSVGEAQEMIVRADLLAKIAAEARSQQPGSRATPTCSICHQIGHNRRRCPST
jgi:hypothetical protein